VGVAAALLIAGRFAALETAERLWALSTDAAAADLQLRRIALWSRAGWAALAAGWFVAHLLVFMRAVSSVQFPRRLGNLEIAEAVPRDLLTGGLVAAGIALGVVITADTGQWWLAGLLAATGVEFGITDPHLGHDLGYYVAEVPWIDLLQRLARRLVGVAMLMLAGLYTAIGAVRVRERRLFMSDGARRHLAVLGTLAAITIAWSTSADGPRVVAGLAGERALATIQDRLLASAVLPLLALATALATLTWVFSRKGLATVAGWAMLVSAWLVLRVFVPLGGNRTPTYTPELVQLAFDLPPNDGDPIHLTRPADTTPQPLTAAVAGAPVWDPEVLAARYAATEAGRSRSLLGIDLVAPDAPDGGTRWLAVAVPSPGRDEPVRVARRGEEARAGPILEFDGATGLVTDTETGDLWFAPGLTWFAIADADAPGISLGSVGVRVALAWALQSGEVLGARGRLLWRRSPEERLERLAPFAEFRDPRLVRGEDGRLVWALDGYVTAPSFAAVPEFEWLGTQPVRYARAGLVGTVDGRTGHARIYVVPDPDPLTAAWVSAVAPLIRSAQQIPKYVSEAILYPETLFRLQRRVLAEEPAVGGRRPSRGTWSRSAVGWLMLPGDSVPRVWRISPLRAPESDNPGGLLAGTRIGLAPSLVRLRFGAPVSIPRWPEPAGDSSAGPRYLWPVEGAMYTQQSVFLPDNGASLAIVRVTWGERTGAGLDHSSAMDALGAPGTSQGIVPDVWGRLARAQALLNQADSLLTSGDLVGFAQKFEELRRLLVTPRPPR
jgi:hypothetical protein